jgi:uncharacterized protein (TIGR03083 family)
VRWACAGIVGQADLLASTVKAADLAVRVPSCPDWNLAQLMRHVGGVHRWIEETVRTRATAPTSDGQARQLSGRVDTDPAVLAEWLAEGAARLAATLREAGPVWTPVPRSRATPTFYARRMAHETAIHRADATLAVGVGYELAGDVAADALDEWLELGALPEILDVHPGKRALLGAGRTLAFRATGTGVDTSWFLDLTGDLVTGRHGAGSAAVTVRGPLTELLLGIYLLVIGGWAAVLALVSLVSFCVPAEARARLTVRPRGVDGGRAR